MNLNKNIILSYFGEKGEEVFTNPVIALHNYVKRKTNPLHLIPVLVRASPHIVINYLFI